jgi:mono/diheme cytochrome c family protein/glucose/arabinose dehydrogenase
MRHRPRVHAAASAAFRFLAISSITAAVALAQNGDRAGETQGELPPEWRVTDAPVRSAAEELATFSIVDGYTVALAAAEPLVEAPVVIEFGPDGRMWVVEMRGYMRDATGAGETERLGRIKVLSDTDGDGTMDKAEIFLDGLVMPRGIAHWRDGLLVIEPPHLLFVRDTNGDGRADESRIVASGFAGQDNPEHAGNGLHYTLDNTFTCSQHPYRFVPEGDTLRAEPVAPHGQWGISEDAVGRLYYSPNSDPLLVDLLPKQYAARNPSLKSFEGVPARAATDMRVHPSHLTPGVNRAYQKGVLKDGRLANFTGACSPLVYEGAALEGMRGTALICEVAGNLVHRYRLTEKDGRITATPADGDRSFWTSTDERFRPVATAVGPDGAIYVADMYRGIIQHRNFMTTFLRTQVDARGLAQPVDAGRIWRITATGAAPARATDLSRASGRELAAALASGEKTVRETARRLIVERRDADAIAAIRAQLAATPAPPTALRLEHLWALAGSGAADRALVDAELAHPDATVRVHAVRIAERCLSAADLAGTLTRAVEDADPAVRVQAALSAGALDAPLRMAILEPALRRDLAAREMRSAAMSSVVGAESALLDSIMHGAILDTDSVAARAFAAELTDMLLDDGSGRPSPDMLRGTMSSIAAVSGARPWLARAMLERVAAKQRLNAKEPVQLVANMRPAGWWEMLDANHPELQLAVSIDRNVFWPGREDVSFVPPRIAKAASMSFEEFGKRLYSNCMSCHQANGRGLPPVYPPLRGSEIVLGEPSTLVKILMHGLEGKLTVDGQTYNQVMPAAAVKSDEEIAAVLTYVRSAWGNAAPAVDPALVAKVREETKGRNRAFTTKELGLDQ